MSPMQVASRPADFHAAFAGRRTGSLLEIDAWTASDIKAISLLVESLMRLIQASHCMAGEESAVELALRAAMNNAVLHGNRLDARKLVHVRCRCKVGRGISVIVAGQGQAFDESTVPDCVSVESLQAEHGRGIQLMKLAMDEVSFEERGTEVHMSKRLVRHPEASARSDSRGF